VRVKSACRFDLGVSRSRSLCGCKHWKPRAIPPRMAACKSRPEQPGPHFDVVIPDQPRSIGDRRIKYYSGTAWDQEVLDAISRVVGRAIAISPLNCHG
jgi:hypothetical protein